MDADEATETDDEAELVVAAVIIYELIRQNEEPLTLPRLLRQPSCYYEQFEFTLDTWPELNYRFELAVDRHEAERLITVLDIEAITFRNRLAPSPVLALCVTLARLKYPSRWKSHSLKFGRSFGYLSVVFTDVIEYLSTTFDQQLTWHPRLRSYRRLREFARAVDDAGAGGLIWGFIDGHFMEFARPKMDQRLCYSGHSKAHGLKMQAITTPDGLVSSLYGPFPGKDNDWNIYSQSRIKQRLQRLFTSDRQMLWLYGDPAYSQSFGILAPYKHSSGRHALPREHQQFNYRMSKYRISVEHSFGAVWRKWTYTGFAKSLRNGQQALGSIYRTAVLLDNCITCLRGGNQTSKKYNMAPPSIEEYLALIEL
jgi:nuclease HARBI1